MVTRSVTRSVAPPVAYPVAGRSRPLFLRNLFSPAALFANGEKGAWYDPSDLSTLFQDVAGTVPVTAAGQLVALMLDKSGNGNHASQSASASQPKLQMDGSSYYLNLDGSDDFLVANAFDLSTTNQVAMFAGVHKTNDSPLGMFAEFSANSNNNAGSFRLMVPGGTSDGAYILLSGGTTRAGVSAYGYLAPHKCVLTMRSDIGSPLNAIRVNKDEAFSTNATQGGGTFGNYPLYIGRRAGTSFPALCRMYGFIIRGTSSTDAEQNNALTWLAAKTGVTP